VKACVVNVNARRAGGNPEGSAGGVKPFATQLADVVLADDPQLVIAQKLLLRELAALADESATKALVDLASDPRTSPDLLAVARPALANRRNGATYMEAALQRHYDYLKDVLRAPPVGPLAHALGAMKKKPQHLPAAHLFDPADTEDDVKETAAALAVVGGPGELPAMRQFFGMYRASAELEDIADAVVSIGGAIVALDPKAGRAQVETALHDPMTVSYARDRLGAALAPPPAHQLDSEPKRK
jgi:outer membrane protein assembly factor BamB